jgi:hypothetical protein
MDGYFRLFFVKANAVQALADQRINACARNYYLTYAKELTAKPATQK